MLKDDKVLSGLIKHYKCTGIHLVDMNMYNDFVYIQAVFSKGKRDFFLIVYRILPPNKLNVMNFQKQWQQ